MAGRPFLLLWRRGKDTRVGTPPEEERMGKTILAALLVFALVAAATVPASAQDGLSAPASSQSGQLMPPAGSKAPRDEDSLYRGAYEVTGDGALIYGGDVRYRCDELVGLGAPAKPGSEDVTVGGGVVEPLTREAVELCAKAGFPPEGAVLGASATSSASAAVEGPDAEQGDALPETGGLNPPALMLAAVASLAAGAAVALRAKR